jgi:uncharacterized protein
MIERINQAIYRPAWLVKPTHACNLDCKYCYDTDMRKKYGDGIMSMEVWEKIVQIASKYCAQIIFHGGEPLMAGIDWYQKAFDIADKYPPLTYGMQSNGTLLNEDFINMFIKHNLSYGFSYDFFSQADYRGKNEDVLTSMSLAKSRGLPVGCICVVTKSNVNRLIEIFEYASTLLTSNLAFNPMFYSGNAITNNMDMLTASDIRNGFRDYFEHYKNRTNKRFTEREAETYFSLVNGVGATQCVFVDCRAAWVGVSMNGDLYPCDRNYGEEYKYGNVIDFSNVTEFIETAGFSK